ncbi:MAG: hypothetical protein NTV93_17065 [Verrucomicrobia bacterium]|nr:hypothetical protein [Verrucomicrobiota bacterium]
MKSPISFRPRAVFACLGALVAACLLAGCAKKPSADWTRIDSEFLNPPNDCRIVQYGGHDGSIVPIDKMREYGIGGVQLFMSVHNYLRNEEAWAAMIANIREAKKAGMQVWVADDNGYPSTQAGGLVVAADPKFELRVLAQLSQRGNGPQPVRIDLPPGAEKFVRATLYPIKDGRLDYDAGIDVPVQGDSIQATGLPGQWALYAFMQQINNDAGSPARGTMQGFGNTGHYPNLLNPDAMAKFVDLTHAEYARRLGPLAGQIDLFYTNEPHLGSIWHTGGERPGGMSFLPWSEALPERFRQDHGYDLMPFLPALYAGESDEAKLVRRHFYQTVGNIYAENITGRFARWCGENGVKSGGHLFGEERMDMHVICSGNYFQALQKQQAPGCDIPMPDPGDHWNYWMPKLVSSVAQLQNREEVTCLLDPLIDRKGDTSFLTASLEQVMRYLNVAFLCGVNHISSYSYWDKYPPEAYRKINEQVGRLALMLRGAKNASNVALYYPIESFQSTFRPVPGVLCPINIRSKPANYDPQMILMEETQEQVIQNLYEHGADFSWLDGGAVLAAKLSGGRLVVGSHDYTTIVMPRVELLPLAVMKKLEEFQKAGGKVLWVDAVPRLGDAPEEHAAVRAAVAGVATITPEQVVGSLGEAFPGSFRLRFDAENKDILIGRFERDGRRINYVVNKGSAAVSPRFRLEGKASGSVQVYNPADGTITTQTLPAELTMPPSSSLFLVEGD